MPATIPDFVNSTDPNFSSSALAVFDQEFGLPDPPSFTKYNQLGQTSPLPAPMPGWGLEITLDVEWAHAIAPDANIELVEGSKSTLGDLAHASNSAATVLNASVVSQSFGGYLEYFGEGYYEQELDATYYAPAFAANPNVTFLAATGDGGAALRPDLPFDLSAERGRWRNDACISPVTRGRASRPGAAAAAVRAISIPLP